MRRILVLSLLLVPGTALACKCDGPAAVCQRVAVSDVVFIGTVESIVPHFLDYWNPAQKQSLTLLNAETARAQADRAASTLAAAKSAYAGIFPDLPEDSRKLLEAAKSHADLVKAFYAILGNGRRVRLTVRTAYRGEEDEDETVEIWTPFDDCGFDFQTGETYLVYADDDEKSGMVSTSSCSGTKRLSDAGGDLAYLYFFKNNGDDSARLDGFDASNQTPTPGVLIELKSDRGSRFTETAADGRFVFDGLEAGDYSIAAYGPGYPKTVKVLAGPQHVHVDAKVCAAATLLISKPPDL
jgi:Carboxypeptidase regulatory-like domain